MTLTCLSTPERQGSAPSPVPCLTADLHATGAALHTPHQQQQQGLLHILMTVDLGGNRGCQLLIEILLWGSGEGVGSSAGLGEGSARLPQPSTLWGFNHPFPQKGVRALCPYPPHPYWWGWSSPVICLSSSSLSSAGATSSSSLLFILAMWCASRYVSDSSPCGAAR